METHVSAAPAAQPPQKNKRIKFYLTWSGIAVLSYATIFAVGYFRGREELSTVTAKLDQVTKSREAARKDVEAQHIRVQRLEARRYIDQALAALDARNFGIAQQRLTEAEKALTKTHVAGKLLEVSKSLESFRVVATEDLGKQRQKLLELVSTFDQAYPAL